MKMITGLIAGVIIQNLAILKVGEVVPVADAGAIGERGAFNLVCGGGGTPDKIARKRRWVVHGVANFTSRGLALDTIRWM